MNDAAFIQAIRDEPHDDVPRLVYADYLEDEGQSLRAELIRIQCELSCGVKDRGRAVEMLGRMRELVIHHRAQWLGPLALHAPVAIFERGFIEEVALPARGFLQDAPAIMAAHPITRLILRGAAGPMDKLAACPELAMLRWMDLRENDLDGPDIEILADSPHLRALTTLNLAGNRIGRTGMRALVATGNLRELETLNLARNGVSDGGAEALACSPNVARLIHLDLSSNGITDRGAEMLAGSPHLARLATLRLGFNRLARHGIEALATSPHLAGLRMLDVFGNNIGNSAAAALRGQFGSRVQC
jgi:uncharacterized protein (TIGR02996 family)